MLGLVKAVLDNRPQQVRLLIKLGSNVNSRTKCGKPLLILCSYMKNVSDGLKMTKLLHRHGADLGLSDDRERNALMHAILNDRPAIAEYLIRNSSEFDLNARDINKNTALHLAVETGSLEMVQCLVKVLRRHLLSLSTSNADGMTPLMVSIVNYKTEIEEYLREILESKDVPSEYPACRNFHGTQKTDIRPSIGSCKGNYIETLLRPKTTPVFVQKGHLRRTVSNKVSGSPSYSVGYPSVDKNFVYSHRVTLPKLFNLWQNQLSTSYLPAAVPKYEESHYRDVTTVITTSEDLDSSRPPTGFRDRFPGLFSLPASPYLRTRSALGTGRETPGNHFLKHDTLAPPSLEPHRGKSIGRAGFNFRSNNLEVPTDRRSRSASPRPIITVSPV